MYENSPIKASLTASMMVLVESLKDAVNDGGNIPAKKIASVEKLIGCDGKVEGVEAVGGVPIYIINVNGIKISSKVRYADKYFKKSRRITFNFG